MSRTLLVLICLGWFFATEARAATFAVNSTADQIDANPGDGACAIPAPPGTPPTCTLRAAIMEANALAGPDVITLPAGTFLLRLNGTGENAARVGDLDITSPITIIGAGPLATIIDASMLVPRDRVFHVLGGPVTMQQLQIRGGSDQTFGTGIYDQNQTVTLHEVRVQDNQAVSDGGGLRATGANAIVTVHNSTFVHNTAAANGGGIALDNGASMTMDTNSTVTTNRAVLDGGGLYTHGGAIASLTDDTLDDNAANAGGGIANEGATVTITRGAITNGSAALYGGGILNLDGSLTASGTSIASNEADTGGGIYQAQSTGSASATLSSVTLTSNTATGTDGGGGMYANRGNLDMDQSRLETNQATTGQGGGMVLDATTATMTIEHTTITGNTAATNGGGIACPGAGDMISIHRSTIDHNTAGGDGGGVWGAALGTSEVLKSTSAFNSASGAGPGLWLAGQTTGSVVSLLHSTLEEVWLDATGTFDAYHVIFSVCDGGTLTSLGYNLVMIQACSLVRRPTDILGVGPGLGPLQNNGGPTFTRAITPASPAWNTGHPSNCTTGGATDQRGPGFPMPMFFRNCDIGAYEAP